MSDILRDMPIEEVRRIAEKGSAKAMVGTWTLVAPDGRQWKADNPLKCCAAEQRERVPADVALARLRLSMEEDAAAIAQQRGSGEGGGK
jgi:hypothetical protein